MQGVEIAHLNAVISAVLKAYYDLMSSTTEETLRPIGRYGKKDTLGMDSGPEITICGELVRYDSGAVVVTEEAGSDHDKRHIDASYLSSPHTFRTVYIADPTDRSNQLKAFLAEFPKDNGVGNIFCDSKAISLWEEKFGSPAIITGASSAVSCVRRGVPIFSVMVNYITQHLIVSCAAGNRILKLPDERPAMIDLSHVRTNGQLITFPGIDGDVKSMRRFVTFLGDVGKIGYLENYRDSGLMSDKETDAFIHYRVPGGPLRILYLSSLQPRETPVGFILANGEKIGEWIHWLPFVQFANSHTDESQPALALYEVYQDRPWTKDGVLMSTPPNYSVFREFGRRTYIDTSRLLEMPNPSRLRSTLIIAPFDNRWIVRSSNQSGYRSIRF